MLEIINVIQRPTHPKDSKFTAFNHFKELKAALMEHNAIGILNIDSFEVFVEVNGQQFILYPKFSSTSNGAVRYTDNLTSDTDRFIGWRPYLSKFAKSFSDKFTFKKLIEANGLLTPPYSLQNDTALTSLLVKKRSESFGRGIKGPFNTNDDSTLLENDEFFEKFIEGQIGKIWYWNSLPVCMELQEMLYLTGDGISTIEDLINKMPGLNEIIDKHNTHSLLKYFNKTTSYILSKDEKQLIEFRYHLEVNRFVKSRNFRIDQGDFHTMFPELYRLGNTLWNEMQKEICGHLAYTIDAIIDKQQKIWFLEMNTNPLIHTLMYRDIIQTLAKDAQTIAHLAENTLLIRDEHNGIECHDRN